LHGKLGLVDLNIQVGAERVRGLGRVLDGKVWVTGVGVKVQLLFPQYIEHLALKLPQ
jgi:hypothetical protein